jgi:hypothetical protein
MLAKARYYDIICFQLRHNFYPQLDHPLQLELDLLFKDITTTIASGQQLQAPSVSILEQIFNLRIQAIKWLSSNGNFDYSQVLDEVIPQIEKMNSNYQWEVLTENLLFALRCNQRVVENLISHAKGNVEDFAAEIGQLPVITYGQFLATLAYTVPDEAVAQKIVDWTNSSLRIEFAMMAADSIQAGNLKVSDQIINELAFLVADAAQEYAALAVDLGIIKPRVPRQTVSNFSFDNRFIGEQKYLADLGMEDFMRSLPD